MLNSPSHVHAAFLQAAQDRGGAEWWRTLPAACNDIAGTEPPEYGEFDPDAHRLSSDEDEDVPNTTLPRRWSQSPVPWAEGR
jgi:hypothetical protein